MMGTSAELGWRRSSFSTGADQTCVDVAIHRHGVAVRDSKDPEGSILCFSHREWEVFLAGARAGEFDLSPRRSGRRRGPEQEVVVPSSGR